MAMQTATDLFLHELSGIYSAEQVIAQMLPTLTSEATNAQVKQALQQHERETQQQIQNLDQAFRQLGARPIQVECFAVEGLKRQHDEFKREQPSDQVLTGYIVSAAAKTEHYEMAAYRGLVEQAKLMGQQEVARLLQQNLQQEEQMAQQVEQIGRQLGQQMIQSSMGQQPGQHPQAPM
ncbi:MAG: DUF892 family protein [Sphaerobacter sp.]|nr:DUF892 family protein [Sphaerobacter sp.]